jgi:hypothetical protein
MRGGGLRDTTAVAAQYINSLKESIYLRFGSTQVIMSLSTDAQRRLQRAVELGNYDEFGKVSQQLTPPNAASEERRRKARVAVRIYPASGPWTQPSLSVCGNDGKPRTLRHVLELAMPTVFRESEDADAEAVVQGLPAPLDAPIDWLGAACAHPDGFLYVMVRTPSPSPAV